MQTLSIGRESSNNIVLNDNFVSRKHAHLVVSDNGQVLIRDLGSSNGTFVNGNKIQESYLNPGDIVKCAAVLLNWQQYAPNRSIVNAKSSPVTANIVERRPDSSQPFKEQNLSSDSPIIPVSESGNVSTPSGQSEYQSNEHLHKQQQGNTVLPMQQNVIVMGKAKSVGTAFLLAFFFGPLGLLYASVTGGVIMFILTIPILIFTAFIGIFFINPICSIWAVIAANQANAALQNRANGLINNSFQR